jgi:hypothetical protein
MSKDKKRSEKSGAKAPQKTLKEKREAKSIKKKEKKNMD